MAEEPTSAPVTMERVGKEADAAGRPAGIAVQHRDDDRHVRPADRQDQQETQPPWDDDQALIIRAARGDQQHDQGDDADASAAFSACWPGKTRAHRKQALER